MLFRHFTAAAAALFLLAACGKKDAPPAVALTTGVTAAGADAFIAKYNADYRKSYPSLTAAQWVQATYITDDTQLLASDANQRQLSFNAEVSQRAKAFYGLKDLSPDTARALTLIRVGSAAPSDPAEREEVAKLGSKLEANYGTGKWCHKTAAGNDECLALQDIEKIVDNVDGKNSPAAIAEAWAGWHATAKPIRKDYVRFIELQNHAAKASNFADMGEMWRAGYDMTPAEFANETERLWGQVQPLYQALHCAVRATLNAKYGDAVVPKNGLIPAHLLGNMWAQQWGNLYPLMEPYKGVSNLNVTAALNAQRTVEVNTLLAAFKGKPSAKDVAEIEHKADVAMSLKMANTAEDFYTSLGFPALPASFYQKSLLTQPRDRDVVCHASAWDLNLAGDVRIKQCIEADEDQLITIHHEMGHVYYYLMYNQLPPIFQTGAHDGFHEAIGDTITLSLTPAHLQKIGLVKDAQSDDKAVINAQMKKALEKIVFLPWGKLVDQWRWKVMNGEITPAQYNAGWWKLRADYQGVSPPIARSEEDFDPGAKYHIPGNTPYTRYFLSFVLQFQFQKALCDAAGFKGPLYACDIYGNKAAGEKYMAMLKEGASKPWPDTLEKLTGTRQMDASALIEYFAPLMAYLKAQNEGQQCGWDAAAATPAAPPNSEQH